MLLAEICQPPTTVPAAHLCGKLFHMPAACICQGLTLDLLSSSSSAMQCLLQTLNLCHYDTEYAVG